MRCACQHTGGWLAAGMLAQLFTRVPGVLGEEHFGCEQSNPLPTQLRKLDLSLSPLSALPLWTCGHEFLGRNRPRSHACHCRASKRAFRQPREGTVAPRRTRARPWARVDRASAQTQRKRRAEGQEMPILVLSRLNKQATADKECADGAASDERRLGPFSGKGERAACSGQCPSACPARGKKTCWRGHAGVTGGRGAAARHREAEPAAISAPIVNERCAEPPMLSCPVSLSCATAQLSSAARGPCKEQLQRSLGPWLSRHLGRCWMSATPSHLHLIKVSQGPRPPGGRREGATNKWWGISDSTSP